MAYQKSLLPDPLGCSHPLLCIALLLQKSYALYPLDPHSHLMYLSGAAVAKPGSATRDSATPNQPHIRGIVDVLVLFLGDDFFRLEYDIWY